eukprot:TRINITY_DN41351_c0_g1_i2.p1 TRINITY_DN41351_c0_g1~~TRINITY_DN41351_c0_g1_i2.p1  ORF type:complete len:117 (-),score=23.60 TRINITY_DN41351_c0_g1_i2:38-343(-)
MRGYSNVLEILRQFKDETVEESVTSKNAGTFEKANYDQYYDYEYENEGQANNPKEEETEESFYDYLAISFPGNSSSSTSQGETTQTSRFLKDVYTIFKNFW